MHFKNGSCSLRLLVEQLPPVAYLDVFPKIKVHSELLSMPCTTSLLGRRACLFTMLTEKKKTVAKMQNQIGCSSFHRLVKVTRLQVITPTRGPSSRLVQSWRHAVGNASHSTKVSYYKESEGRH